MAENDFRSVKLFFFCFGNSVQTLRNSSRNGDEWSAYFWN